MKAMYFIIISFVLMTSQLSFSNDVFDKFDSFYEDHKRKLLSDIDSVEISINLNADAENIGLPVEKITSQMTNQFNAAGIYVISSEEKIQALKNGKIYSNMALVLLKVQAIRLYYKDGEFSGIIAYSIDTRLMREMSLKDNPDVGGNVPVWESSFIGNVDYTTFADNILNVTKSSVAELIAKLLDANIYK